jgi:hypothetical protein
MIVEARASPGYFLYYCDADWNPITDTWHRWMEEAKECAEKEYEGAKKYWHQIEED